MLTSKDMGRKTGRSPQDIEHVSALLPSVETYRAIAILRVNCLGWRSGEEPISRKAMETF